jgi:Eukaryotic membrane protein family
MSHVIGLSLEDTESSSHSDPGLASCSCSASPADDDNDKENTKSSGPHCNDPSSGEDPSLRSDHEASLEDRIRDLETKLAVLSRLLQFQVPSNGGHPQGMNNGTSSSSTTTTARQRPGRSPPPPPLPPPHAPPIVSRPPTPPSHRDREHADLDVDDGSAMRTPKRSGVTKGSGGARRTEPVKPDTRRDEEEEDDVAAPSAPVPSSDHKRNLSFSLLFDGNEAEYDQKKRLLESTHATESMTPAERLWLQPRILEYQKKAMIADNPQLKQGGANDQEDGKPHDRRTSLSEGRSSPSSNALVPDDSVRSNWLNYLNSFQETNVDVDVQMQEFIQVPRSLEGLMSFGLFICVDSFLYMITILPIRFIWSCFLLLIKVGVWLRRRQRASAPFRFHRRHTYQMIQVMLLYTIYRYVLARISIGVVYHWIRGQSMIKLYVLVAMVEVFDRLFSSLGQDALESMYWNTMNRPRSSRMVVSVAVVWVYAMLHSLLLFGHVATLNVAMNSADQALLTLLISGNFAEIKSTVFKKYNKPALFKITASDICERFKLGLFLSLVMLLNVCQGMDKSQKFDYARICGYVWCAELLSDWIKHSFITKFNFLPSRVYPEYALLLAGDVTGIGHEGVNLDHSHAVVKRIGFAQIPLVCVMFRMLREAYKYFVMSPVYEGALGGKSMWFVGSAVVGGWLFLLAVKMALGILLQRTSLAKLQAAPQVNVMEQDDKNRKKKYN